MKNGELKMSGHGLDMGNGSLIFARALLGPGRTS